VLGVTATLLGGTVTINGLSFTSSPDALPNLEPGSEYLLLLKRVGSRYHIAGTYFGAFQVADGKVTPVTKKRGFAPEYSNVPVAEAAERMAQRSSKSRRAG
jgi:hypothetical protein